MLLVVQLKETKGVPYIVMDYSQYSDEVPQRHSVNADVVTFLHRAGERYKEHLELLRRERIHEEKRLGPGKPVVSPFATEWSSQTTRKSEAVEERLHRLHQKRQEKLASHREQAERDRKTKEMEEVRERLEITELGRHHSGRNPVEVSERFLEDHRNNLKRLAEENIRREMSEVQPKPKITTLAAASKTAERKHGLPIEDHLMRVEHERRQRLFRVVEEKSKTSADTFHPQITEKAKQFNPQHNVVERLYQVSTRPPAAFDETYERECTFTPATNNKHYSYDDPHADVPVHERLFENLPRPGTYGAELSAERQAHRDPISTLTFTPRISTTSQKIVERKRSMNLDSSHVLSPTSRLYEEHQASKATTPSAKSSDKSKEATFHPTINSKSQAIWEKLARSVAKDKEEAKHKTAHELLWEKKVRKREAQLEAIRRELLEREVEGCTFTPNASSGDASVTSVQRHRPEQFAKREGMWVLQRERAMQQMREDLEEYEVDGCTFHPKIHHEIPMTAASVPNAVGFEMHKMRLEEARRRRQEEAERHQTPRATKYRGGPTVPVPFVLGREREQRERQKTPGKHYAGGVGVAALRPPINDEEWQRVRAGFEDASEDEDVDYDDGYARPDSSFYSPARRSAAHSSDDTTFYVQHPRAAKSRRTAASRPVPNPVDFIMSNHRAIMQGLQS